MTFRQIVLVLLGLLLFSHRGLSAAEILVGECKTTYRQRATFAVDHPGLIAKVPEEGDTIEPGDIVIQLRDDVPRANLALALTKAENVWQIEFEQKNVQSNRLEYDSAVEANLISNRSVQAYPLTHIERLKLNVEAAELKVKLAEHEKRIAEISVEQANAELKNFRVISEISGVITQVFKHVGEAAQQGEAIVELVNVDRIRVEGYVSLQDSVLLKKGLPVIVRFDLPGENGTQTVEVKGDLGYVAPTVHTLSSRVRVWADFDNQDGKLREGLPVTMVINPVSRP